MYKDGMDGFGEKRPADTFDSDRAAENSYNNQKDLSKAEEIEANAMAAYNQMKEENNSRYNRWNTSKKRVEEGAKERAEYEADSSKTPAELLRKYALRTSAGLEKNGKTDLSRKISSAVGAFMAGDFGKAHTLFGELKNNLDEDIASQGEFYDGLLRAHIERKGLNFETEINKKRESEPDFQNKKSEYRAVNWFSKLVAKVFRQNDEKENTPKGKK